MKEIAGLVVLALVLIALAGGAYSHKQRTENGKREWFLAHGCKRVAYVGSRPEALFSCRDGQTYTWADMPQFVQVEGGGK